MFQKIKMLFNLTYYIKQLSNEIESLRMQIGNLNIVKSQKKYSTNPTDHEFKVFSQWGEDGIINYLVENINIKNKFFVEFGVSNYLESNTRFLLKIKNWSGLIIDSSPKNCEYIKKDPIYWQYDLKVLCKFINKDNINKLLMSNIAEKNIGLLSIDIDGNDYWIWESISFINPAIVIVEYNSLLGSKKKLVVPYKKDFLRKKAHYSNIYYGASLPALAQLGKKKGYSLVCCNSSGNNAFFVNKKLLNKKIVSRNVSEVFIERKFRESRDIDNNLNFLNTKEQKEIIKNLSFEEI